MASFNKWRVGNNHLNIILGKLRVGTERESFRQLTQHLEEINLDAIPYKVLGAYDLLLIAENNSYSVVEADLDSYFIDCTPIYGYEWLRGESIDPFPQKETVMGLCFLDLDRNVIQGDAIQWEQRIVNKIMAYESDTYDFSCKVYGGIGSSELIAVVGSETPNALFDFADMASKIDINNNKPVLDTRTIPSFDERKIHEDLEDSQDVSDLVDFLLFVTCRSGGFRDQVLKSFEEKMPEPPFSNFNANMVLGERDLLISGKGPYKSLVTSILDAREAEASNSSIFETYTVIVKQAEFQGPDKPPKAHKKRRNGGELVENFNKLIADIRDENSMKNIYDSLINLLPFLSTWSGLISDDIRGHQFVAMGRTFEDVMRTVLFIKRLSKVEYDSDPPYLKDLKTSFCMNQGILHQKLESCLVQRIHQPEISHLGGSFPSGIEKLGGRKRLLTVAEYIANSISSKYGKGPLVCMIGNTSDFAHTYPNLINIPANKQMPSGTWGVAHEVGHYIFDMIPIDDNEICFSGHFGASEKSDRRFEIWDIVKETEGFPDQRFLVETISDMITLAEIFGNDWDLYNETILPYFAERPKIEPEILARCITIAKLFGPQHLRNSHFGEVAKDICRKLRIKGYNGQINTGDALDLSERLTDECHSVKDKITKHVTDACIQKEQSLANKLSQGEILKVKDPKILVRSLLRLSKCNLQTELACMLSIYNSALRSMG